MKVINCKSILLGSALLGICTTVSLTSPAQAAPRNKEVKQARKEVKQARKEVKQERKDVRRADTPAERRREQQDLNRARRDVREERQDVRQERAGNNRNYNRPDYNRPGYNRPNAGNRPSYNRPGDNRPNYNGGRSYVGTVTRVRSSQSFDVNIGGNTFNVYLDSLAPRGLSQGDTVRITGVQQYNNDIRNARVSIVRNR